MHIYIYAFICDTSYTCVEAQALFDRTAFINDTFQGQMLSHQYTHPDAHSCVYTHTHTHTHTHIYMDVYVHIHRYNMYKHLHTHVAYHIKHTQHRCYSIARLSSTTHSKTKCNLSSSPLMPPRGGGVRLGSPLECV